MKLCEHKKSNGRIWSFVAGVALVAFAAGLIANFADIKRYIKITTM
jgi:hypothetical protein